MQKSVDVKRQADFDGDGEGVSGNLLKISNINHKQYSV